MLSPAKDEPKQESSLQQTWAGTIASFFSTGEDPEHKEQSSRRNSRAAEEPVPSPRLNRQQNPRLNSGSDDADLTGVTLPLPKDSTSTHGSPLATTGTTARPDSSDGYEDSPSKLKSVSHAPAVEGGDQAHADPIVLTAFAEQLATATQRAPQRLAERLLEQLQHDCLEEASKGQSSYTWETQLSSMKTNFMQQVGRSFAARVENLGFEQVEWWNGQEWIKKSGTYYIPYDRVYEKYLLKIRVRWLDKLPPEEAELAAQESAARRQGQPSELSVLETLQQWLEAQKQELERQLAESEAQAAAGSQTEPTDPRLNPPPELSGCSL